MQELLDLDAKGLLPRKEETAAAFKRRGSRTLLSYANPQWLERFIAEAAEDLCRCDPHSFHRVQPASDQQKVFRFQEGVAALGQAVGADLSWVPVVEYCSPEFDPEHPVRVISGFSSTLLREEGYFLPFMGINVGPTSNPAYFTGAHEAFHTLRWPLDRSSRRAARFDHLGANIVRPLRRWLPSESSGRDFRSAWIRLRWAFGKDAAYVLTRLSYGEITENIIGKLNGMNPRQYIMWAAGFKHNLRHRIMAARLGL